MKNLKVIVRKVPLDSRSRKLFDLLENYELFQMHRQDDDQIFATRKVKFKDPKMHSKMLENKHYGMSYIEVIKEDRGNKEFIDKLALIIYSPIILD